MRLPFLTQALAQTAADSIHTRMLAADADYLASVRAGQTTAWANPYQDLDAVTLLPIASTWYVNVKPRCEPVLTALELLARVADRLQ